jgi:hypothetical protein
MHKFSANRCHPRPNRGTEPASPRPSLDRVPLFLLFLREIISDEASFAAGILDFQQHGAQKTADNDPFRGDIWNKFLLK